MSFWRLPKKCGGCGRILYRCFRPGGERANGNLALAFFQCVDPALASLIKTPKSMSMEFLVKSSLSSGSKKILATFGRNKNDGFV